MEEIICFHHEVVRLADRPYFGCEYPSSTQLPAMLTPAPRRMLGPLLVPRPVRHPPLERWHLLPLRDKVPDWHLEGWIASGAVDIPEARCVRS